MVEFKKGDTSQIRKVIRDIPRSDLNSVPRSFVTQGGQCAVWVTERLEPGEPFVSEGSISFPYRVHRPDHQYNCTDRNRDSGHTTPATPADINSMVTANYKVKNGKLIISNIVDRGKNQETDAGAPIVRKLELFS